MADQPGQGQPQPADQQHALPGKDGALAALQVHRGVSPIIFSNTLSALRALCALSALGALHYALCALCTPVPYVCMCIQVALLIIQSNSNKYGKHCSG